MSKIEEVARAIYEGRNGRGCTPWSRLPKAHQEPYLADARAAIKAMREPSTAMKAAASRIPHARDEEIYIAMIDAALREEGR